MTCKSALDQLAESLTLQQVRIIETVMCDFQEGKAAAARKATVAGPLRSSSGMAEGLRPTLRKKSGALHLDLAHSGGSGLMGVLADAADHPEQARQPVAHYVVRVQGLLA